MSNLKIEKIEGLESKEEKKEKLVVGIDVAKDTLCFSIYNGNKHIVKDITYNKTNIKKELLTPNKNNKENITFVCEGTGVYHTKLVAQLYSDGFNVSVINPFVIKKYSEMKLMRVKTDSVDAKLIASYGYENKLRLWAPKSSEVIEVDNILKAIDDFIKMRTSSNNQVKALGHSDSASKDVTKRYISIIKVLNNEIKKLEKKLKDILNKNFKEEYELLTSIPGIGLKVSSMIISAFDSFKSFDNAKQACSFAGIAPNPYQSGTSVKGRGSISKRGNTFARKLLYMGALSAILHNSFIKAQYNRLLEKGKSKMQAVIASAHKLLRLAFGVLKSGKMFDDSYVREYVVS